MMWRQRQRIFSTALVLILGTAIISPPPFLSCAAAEECAADDNVYEECTTAQKDDTSDESIFYAWSSFAENSLIRALFPDANQFKFAWEVHPLLSRVSYAKKQQKLEPNGSANLAPKIPTSIHDRSSISRLSRLDNNHNNDPILSLFSVDDTPTILSQPKMTHGSDYKLVKKIILPSDHPTSPGEEYNGMLPKPHYSMQEVMQHFHYGAFSLVINKVQKRWKSIARMARRIEEELGVMNVGVNLYLTPEVVLESGDDLKNGEVRQGFESHWDWMDVIVIQMSGRKRWSVAREPSIYLSNKDQKRKPNNNELKEVQRYNEFTLCPGDVLYIPRGHIHNASTVIFDNLLDGNDDDDGSGSGLDYLDLDSCPSYPKGMPSADLLSDRLDGPSLHLTFGLLQSNDATIESLLHHALDAYFASAGGSAEEKVAIPANTCSSQGETAMDYDLEWKSVLHHSLAEVARREHPCDNILLSNHGAVDTGHPERCDGTAILRQSVPLLLLSNNLLKGSADDMKGTQQYSNLEQTYFLALESFRSSAGMSNTIGFIQTHLLRAPEDGALTFHYPSYSKKDVILCPDAMKTLPEERYSQLLRSFDQFAEDNFYQALKDMNLWAKETRDDIQQRQQLDLEMVGQG